MALCTLPPCSALHLAFVWLSNTRLHFPSTAPVCGHPWVAFAWMLEVGNPGGNGSGKGRTEGPRAPSCRRGANHRVARRRLQVPASLGRRQRPSADVSGVVREFRDKVSKRLWPSQNWAHLAQLDTVGIQLRL